VAFRIEDQVAPAGALLELSMLDASGATIAQRKLGPADLEWRDGEAWAALSFDVEHRAGSLWPRLSAAPQASFRVTALRFDGP
jgi:hypothetical protein